MKIKPIQAFAVALLLSSPLMGQAIRTFVSTSGLDTNPCSRSAPCRQFNAALAAVAPDGEIIALDSGGFGPVVVNKTVSIIATDNVHAAIAPSSGVAISVTGFARLYLRGLTLNKGTTGILADIGTQVYVQNCSITNAAQDGIVAHGQLLVVNNSIISGHGGAGILLSISRPTDVVAANIIESRVSDNQDGIRSDPNCRVVVRGSNIAGNSRYGVHTSSNSAKPAQATLKDSRIVNGAGTALLAESDGTAGSTSTIRLIGSVVSWNGTGMASSPLEAHILTNQNNTVEGNAVEGSFTGVIATQ